MRKLLMERSWQELRVECHHLRGTGGSYGYNKLSDLAAAAEDTIPAAGSPRAESFPATKQAIESLVAEIDSILTEGKLADY